MVATINRDIWDKYVAGYNIEADDYLRRNVLYDASSFGRNDTYTREDFLYKPMVCRVDTRESDAMIYVWYEDGKANWWSDAEVVRLPENCFGLFYFCDTLLSIDLRGFQSDRVINMEGMFDRCESLERVELGGLDTGRVTDMSSMFNFCSSLRELDLSGFRTGEVTDMSYMFEGCGKLSRLNLGGFDAGKVTDIAFMFDGCASLRQDGLIAKDAFILETFQNHQ